MEIALQKNRVRESGYARQGASCQKTMSQKAMPRVSKKHPRLPTREAMVSLVCSVEDAVLPGKIRVHADSQ